MDGAKQGFQITTGRARIMHSPSRSPCLPTPFWVPHSLRYPSHQNNGGVFVIIYARGCPNLSANSTEPPNTWRIFLCYDKFMVIIQILALAGLVDSVYLRWRRMRTPTNVCPLGQDCNALYNLPQAKFLGIHWDFWGILFYALLFYISFDFVEVAFKVTVIKILAAIGLVVSAYLLYIQYRVRNYCSWCLLSELITLLIVITTFSIKL